MNKWEIHKQILKEIGEIIVTIICGVAGGGLLIAIGYVYWNYTSTEAKMVGLIVGLLGFAYTIRYKELYSSKKEQEDRIKQYNDVRPEYPVEKDVE